MPHVRDGQRHRPTPLGRLHAPRFCRYEVAHPVRFKAGLNRYPGCVIGAGVVIGRHAYNVKWGWAN